MVADINSGIIFALLPFNAILIATSCYNTEHVNNFLKFFFFSKIKKKLFEFQSAADMAPAFILYNVLCIVSSLMWPYIFGHFATRVTERILSIGDIAYDSNWYEYPGEFRKYIILIIARSHQEIYFTGFNLVVCTLEVFGKVLHSIYLDIY